MLLHLNFKGALFKNARRKNLPPRCLELLHFFPETEATYMLYLLKNMIFFGENARECAQAYCSGGEA